MKIYLIIVALLGVLLNPIAIWAQQKSMHGYLDRLPNLPEKILGATEQKILLWTDSISKIQKEIEQLEYEEKEQLSICQANAKPNPDLFSEINSRKIQKIQEQIGLIELQTDSILRRNLSFLIEHKGEIELKYLAILEPLYDKKRDIISKNRSSSEIDHQIFEVNKRKCEEQYLVKKEYFKLYRQSLNELNFLGVKANELSDSMSSILYTNYLFKTKYGVWLGFLIGYVNEIAYIYNDLPMLDSNIDYK